MSLRLARCAVTKRTFGRRQGDARCGGPMFRRRVGRRLPEKRLNHRFGVRWVRDAEAAERVDEVRAQALAGGLVHCHGVGLVLHERQLLPLFDSVREGRRQRLAEENNGVRL